MNNKLYIFLNYNIKLIIQAVTWTDKEVTTGEMTTEATVEEGTTTGKEDTITGKYYLVLTFLISIVGLNWCVNGNRRG